jgi:starch synthase
LGLRIAILTKEYPPYTYGGAGVHVDRLTKELASLDGGSHQICLLCFGDQNEALPNTIITGVNASAPVKDQDPGRQILLDTLSNDVAMVGKLDGADVIHCHTWYTHLAGCLLKQILRAPLVLTTHSLEAQRPWKKEQLGPAYSASLWMEKTAYHNADAVIAVSAAMKQDVHRLYGVPLEKIHVIHNGIDTETYRPVENGEVLRAYGIDAGKPFILSVARLTRQKGIGYFLDSVKYLNPGIQVVLCASSPDTADYMEEIAAKVEAIRSHRSGRVIWIKESVPVNDLVVLYTHASLFVCPSIYEPFGITNLEAMACRRPVVASAVGGIPEVVMDGETGRLVRFAPAGPDHPEPEDPERFIHDLAAAIDDMLLSPERLRAMGEKARQRVIKDFSWTAVARRTADLYIKLADTSFTSS